MSLGILKKYTFILSIIDPSHSQSCHIFRVERVIYFLNVKSPKRLIKHDRKRYLILQTYQFL